MALCGLRDDVATHNGSCTPTKGGDIVTGLRHHTRLSRKIPLHRPTDSLLQGCLPQQCRECTLIAPGPAQDCTGSLTAHT